MSEDQRPLRIRPDKVLRAASLPVERFDVELRSLVGEMYEKMHHFGGVGLAAVQIGVPLRVFTATIAGQDRMYINPNIVGQRGQCRPIEGCLSVPGCSFTPLRPTIVHLQWLDLEQRSQYEEFTGLHAEIIAHEMDHLDGIMIPDRMLIGRDW